MNSQTPPVIAPRRRVWPWIVGLILAPFVIVAVGVASYATLDRDATILRRHVMKATNADWQTKVQFSVGRATLGMIHTGMRFVDSCEMAEARAALRTLNHASVGVYELKSDAGKWSPRELLTSADATMRKRGWSRLVGVTDQRDTVMVYVQDDLRDDKPVDVCVAVLSDREFVVVSATIDIDAVGELVARHGGDEFKREIRHLARR